MLEALGRLCRGAGGQELVALLGQQAPTWLVQMPGLVRAADLEALKRRIVGATRDRMLRELAEAIDLLTVQQPLVLVLEDLHWSDPSTLDLLAVLARRREPARLLLLGTYRPPEVRRRAHPLPASAGTAATRPLRGIAVDVAAEEALPPTSPVACRACSGSTGWRTWCTSAPRAIRSLWSNSWRPG